mgnify:CR=1 FL=1
MTTATPNAIPVVPVTRIKKPGQPIFFFVISLLGVLFSLGSGGFLLFVGKFMQTEMPRELGETFTAQMGMYSVLILISLIASVISMVHAIREMSGRPAKPLRPMVRWTVWSALLLPWLAGLIWFRLLSESLPSWIGKPVLLFFITVVPLVWFLEVGRRKILEHSRCFSTGSVTMTVTFGLGLILFLESTILMIGVGVGMGFLLTDPNFFNELFEAVSITGNQQELVQRMMELLGPLMENPWVILGILAVFALIVPLIEEFFKPLGLWFVSGAKITPPQGALLGMLAGFGFALWESYGYMQMLMLPMDMQMIALRAGTGILHIFCSGLVGWGLASAWWYKRSSSAVWTFLVALLIHGVWNGVSILSGTRQMGSGEPTGMKPLFLVFFGVTLGLMVFFQWRLNLKLQEQQAEIEGPDAPAELPVARPGMDPFAPHLEG